MSAGEPLPQSERCLSSSDFGYHNAIETRDGELRFVDFEYAGWDDPAKLVCDFFHQVQVPVPKSHFERFSLSICRLFERPEILRRRIELLMPVFGIKWCCIVLNEFLPTSAERRSFSGGPDRADERERKARQLEKSRELLASLCRD